MLYLEHQSDLLLAIQATRTSAYNLNIEAIKSKYVQKQFYFEDTRRAISNICLYAVDSILMICNERECKGLRGTCDVYLVNTPLSTVGKRNYKDKTIDEATL